MFRRRRKHEREKVTDCHVNCLSSKWSCESEALDISEGGMRLDMEEVPAIGDEIELHMTCESGRALNRKAVVVWFIKKSPPQIGSMV